MSDNFRVTLMASTPRTTKRPATLRCRVTQCHPDAPHLSRLREEADASRLSQFVGRLLADARVPEFATDEPWNDDAAFPFLDTAPSAITFVSFTSHDLLQLIDHGRPALGALSRRAHWPELLRGDEAVVRDEPGHYSNFLDEAVLKICLAVPLPSACIKGLSWGSSAFA